MFDFTDERDRGSAVRGRGRAPFAMMKYPHLPFGLRKYGMPAGFLK
jgi:hypothetical protein